MHEYTMTFIRTSPDIDWEARNGRDWDDGLVNFGYEACELLKPIPLKAIDIEAAKVEAETYWQEWVEDVHTENAEGYWIRRHDGRVQHFHVAIEEEDYVR
jgi:hypothetical protein